MLRITSTLCAGVAGALLVASGCTTQKTQPVAERPASQAPARVTDARSQPQVVNGRITSTYAFPTGHPESSMLLLERDLPAEIVSGQEFSYELKLTNIGHTSLDAVTLRDECATELVLISADPLPVAQKPPFVWSLGDMKPKESRTVRVTGKVSGRDEFTSCAFATYNESVCLTANVVEPSLRLALSAPAEATPCDTIPVKLIVSNAGTGSARDVRVAYALPSGWTTADGKATAQFNIDALAEKETRELTVNAKPAKTGEFTSRATVSAWPNLSAESAPATTSVRQAVLAVEAMGPTSIYTNRNAVISFTVTNNGTATATNATFDAAIPTGAKFISATEGGKLSANHVLWNLQSIPVKASRKFAMTIEPQAVGKLDVGGVAKAYCAEPARDVVSVSVEGFHALLLEVTDLMDPVEVNSETTYEIVITNQGTIAASNVRIVATLEDMQAYASTTGASARVSGATVTFDPIPSIAPKAKAVLRLVVKCVKDGDTRFKVSMTADQIDRPVEETESTHIYR